MRSRLSRQVTFLWRERYLKLWSWLKRFRQVEKELKPRVAAASSQELWLERLKQHFKRPPHAS